MRIHHIAIITSDYARGKAFYCDVLGLTVLAEHYRSERDSWKCDLALNGEYAIELFSFPDPPLRPGYGTGTAEACGLRHLAFAVEDIQAKHAELSEKGIACEAIREDEYTDKLFFFIQDPDGLPLEFYQQ